MPPMVKSKITVHFEDVPTSTGTNFPADRESI
jgi:hypothetical protein